MHYFYSDNPERPNTQIDVWKINGTKAYIRHYNNKLFLLFVANSPRSSFREKLQAEMELRMCEKKLAFWHRHPNTDHEQLRRLIEKANRDWQLPS